MPIIAQKTISSAYTYESFLALSTALFAEGKTTGPIQDELHVRISGLNLKRMTRLEKTTRLLDKTLATLQNIT